MDKEEWIKKNGSRGTDQGYWIKRNGARGINQEESGIRGTDQEEQIGTIQLSNNFVPFKKMMFQDLLPV